MSVDCRDEGVRNARVAPREKCKNLTWKHACLQALIRARVVVWERTPSRAAPDSPPRRFARVPASARFRPWWSPLPSPRRSEPARRVVRGPRARWPGVSGPDRHPVPGGRSDPRRVHLAAAARAARVPLVAIRQFARAPSPTTRLPCPRSSSARWTSARSPSGKGGAGRGGPPFSSPRRRAGSGSS